MPARTAPSLQAQRHAVPRHREQPAHRQLRPSATTTPLPKMSSSAFSGSAIKAPSARRRRASQRQRRRHRAQQAEHQRARSRLSVSTRQWLRVTARCCSPAAATPPPSSSRWLSQWPHLRQRQHGQQVQAQQQLFERAVGVIGHDEQPRQGSAGWPAAHAAHHARGRSRCSSRVSLPASGEQAGHDDEEHQPGDGVGRGGAVDQQVALQRGAGKEPPRSDERSAVTRVGSVTVRRDRQQLRRHNGQRHVAGHTASPPRARWRSICRPRWATASTSVLVKGSSRIHSSAGVRLQRASAAVPFALAGRQQRLAAASSGVSD